MIIGHFRVSKQQATPQIISYIGAARSSRYLRLNMLNFRIFKIFYCLRGVMWRYERLVRMRDTDATGALFFGVAFEMATEAFEEWLYFHEVKLTGLSFLLPVVHAEADYLSPVRLGDLLRITLSLKKIGTTSFTVRSVFSTDKEVGNVNITHVAVSKDTGHKIEVPAALKHLLEGEGSSRI